MQGLKQDSTVVKPSDATSNSHESNWSLFQTLNEGSAIRSDNLKTARPVLEAALIEMKPEAFTVFLEQFFPVNVELIRLAHAAIRLDYTSYENFTRLMNYLVSNKLLSKEEVETFCGEFLGNRTFDYVSADNAVSRALSFIRQTPSYKMMTKVKIVLAALFQEYGLTGYPSLLSSCGRPFFQHLRLQSYLIDMPELNNAVICTFYAIDHFDMPNLFPLVGYINKDSSCKVRQRIEDSLKGFYQSGLRMSDEQIHRFEVMKDLNIILHNIVVKNPSTESLREIADCFAHIIAYEQAHGTRHVNAFITEMQRPILLDRSKPILQKFEQLYAEAVKVFAEKEAAQLTSKTKKGEKQSLSNPSSSSSSSTSTYGLFTERAIAPPATPLPPNASANSALSIWSDPVPPATDPQTNSSLDFN